MSLKWPYLKIIVFDFDGTLIESNQIKDKAFELLFGEWPEYQNAMMRWHFDHNSIDRREKFRYFVEKVLGLKGRDDLIRKLTTKFGKITRQAVIDCPFVEGAQNFLEYINCRVKTYLVSATPQAELNIIIKERKLDAYFKKIFGAPIKKIDILKQIMESENATVDEILFIGDSPEDQHAAESLGIHFIGRQSDRPLNKSKNNIVLDFVKIKNYLIKYYKI
jgi:phosphoglycolate phosphatase-like HAD superfamily hydrolase